jgi:arsenate reductase
MKTSKIINKKITQLLNSTNNISTERKELLSSFAEYISKKTKENKPINLVFICTHNSRRSIMAQIWAKTASEHFNIKNIHCFSGGTEATAFNPSAVKAARDVGFDITKKDDSENPIYLVNYSKEAEPIKCFSKVYTHSSNPQKEFCAIMTCSDADANCPVVIGAEARFPIRYDDPKEYDGTPIEEEKYRERFEQIGIEMLFVFSKINF